MKKTLLPIIACIALLLVGCGKDDSTVTTDTTTPINETINTDADEPNYDLYANLFTVYEIKEVKTTRFHQKYMHMIDPQIISIDDTVVIAEGYLANNDYITSEPIRVEYTIIPGAVGPSWVDEVSVPEDIHVIPTVSLEGEYLYGAAGVVRIFSPDGTTQDIYFTEENFPTVDVPEENWINEYEWEGVVTITDNNGNKYITDPYFLSYERHPYYDTVAWRFEQAVLFAYPAE